MAIFMALALVFSSSLLAETIRGEAQIFDLYEVDNPLVRQAANATAAMIRKDYIHLRDDWRTALIEGSPPDENVCPLSRFQNQSSAASCAGFLVSNTLLLTAGHCVKSPNACRSSAWVFDYTVKDQRGAGEPVTVDAGNVYHCAEVVRSSYRPLSRQVPDYAFIRLDRKVEGRAPLALRTEGQLRGDENLVALGTPKGLPLKASFGGVELDRGGHIFHADLEVFPGNSGGPIMNAETGLVEGIVVTVAGKGLMSPVAYIYDEDDRCYYFDRTVRPDYLLAQYGVRTGSANFDMAQISPGDFPRAGSAGIERITGVLPHLRHRQRQEEKNASASVGALLLQDNLLKDKLLRDYKNGDAKFLKQYIIGHLRQRLLDRER